MDVDWVMDDGQASTPRTRKKPTPLKRKIEFVGWGSRELIEFLHSIGKDTTKALSHYDVTNIVIQYVIDSKLINPDKKKRVICDDRLQTLFGCRKQTVFRNKIHDLLEPHFVENHVASENDTCSSDENDDGTATASKRLKVSISDKKTVPKKKVPEVPKSALIAISPENIKLVYLKRSLVKELLSDREKFESKVVGSFVKIKADPYDIYQKNSHQLQPVTGVKKVASAGDDKSPMLQLDSIFNDISISELSDDNFTEEECEDLRRRMKDGLLKHPTVGELERKVVMLHKDITKHWLARELVLLKIRMDQANEKGWRYRVAEYLDRRKLLQTPEEQSRLLDEIPKVLPEKIEVEPETIPDDSPDVEAENPVDSPKATVWDWEPSYNSSAVGVSTRASSKQATQEPLEVCTGININTQLLSPQEPPPSETEQMITERSESFKSVQLDLNVIDFDELNFNEIQTPQIECNGHAKVATTENLGQLLQNSTQENNFPNNPQPKTVEVIDLSDDEDELEPSSNTIPTPTPPFYVPIPGPFPAPEPTGWYYMDPTGVAQGPFLLSDLKRWSDSGIYFDSNFRVWCHGKTHHESLLLTDVLRQAFPSY